METVTIPLRIQRFAIAILYLVLVVFGIVVIAIWAALLVWTVRGMFGWEKLPLNDALQAFGLSLAITCAALWGSHQIQILQLDKETKEGIWKTLIVAVLTAVASSIVTAFPK